MAVTRILAIGNSFSEDAAYYVHPMAEAAGAQVKIVNLYIGGCSLETHWRNIESGEAAYQYQLNGVNTERYVSVEEALGEEAWDYVVTQQASHDSGWLDTYTPFIGRMQAYIRQKAPSAELLLHETWAYETDSSHGAFMRYNRSQTEMFERLRHAYRKTGTGLRPADDSVRRGDSAAAWDRPVPLCAGRYVPVPGRFPYELSLRAVSVGLRLDGVSAASAAGGQRVCTVHCAGSGRKGGPGCPAGHPGRCGRSTGLSEEPPLPFGRGGSILRGF